MNRPDWQVLEEEVERRRQLEEEGEGRKKMADRLLLRLVSVWTSSNTDNSAKGSSADQSISCETTTGKTVAMTASVSGYVFNS